MSWDCLSEEIGGMFAEHSDREYERQLSLEWWATERLAVRRASIKAWRALNKERMREIRRNWNQTDHARKYHRDYMRTWRAKNAKRARTKQREQKRKWRKANRDRFSQYMRDWRAANRERDNARQRERRAANREQVNAYQRERYARMKGRN